MLNGFDASVFQSGEHVTRCKKKQKRRLGMNRTQAACLIPLTLSLKL